MFKRGGVWWTKIRFNGRLIQKSLKTGNKKLALAIEGKIRTSLVEGRFFDTLEGKKKTFSELAAKYLKEESINKSPLSRERDRGIFANHLIPAFGTKKLTEIGPRDISKYKFQRKEAGAKAETINKELGLMKSAFYVAIKEWEWLNSNPVSKVRMEKVPKGRVRYLSEEEFDRLYQNCPDWLKPIVMVARYTGLRMSNVLSLRWDQIDLFRKEILIENESMKNDEAIGIPICETLFECLKKLRSIKVKNIKKKVFHYPYEYKTFQRRVQRTFKTACNRAGLKDFRWHDLRHDFASMLIQGGTELYSVQRLLGHKDGRMTQRYAHLSPENLRKAVKVLDKRKGVSMTTEENSGYNLATVQGLKM